MWSWKRCFTPRSASQPIGPEVACWELGVSQPTLSLSTVPILVKKGIAPRHVDLRPYVLVSDRVRIMPGGLTRVALREGS